MSIDQNDITKILNLKSHEDIADVIAQRQLAVIKKGYEYLSKPGNCILYIADEVGLGKTYIGLGIAAMLRHSQDSAVAYIDGIIVPKRNLQDKWLKELRNFASNNYLDRSRGYDELANKEGIVHDRIRPIPSGSSFNIYRMTSFSSLISSRSELLNYFKLVVFQEDPFCEQVLEKAYRLGYFYDSEDNDKNALLHLISCLLNAVSERIDCLIIDEAHNYKYGVSENGEANSSRNRVTARFLGAIQDQQIITAFPEVHARMKYPLANKVICLSATPKDRNLEEIKRQLDCFTHKHLLNGCRTKEDILCQLPNFLIRGNLQYVLEGETFSRNQCRHEHRRGNVERSAVASAIEMGDNLDNVFWQLLQYQSIRQLSQKANASFEIGMLAGFESYQIDIDKRLPAPDEKEYEITSQRNKRDSEDANIIRTIVESYKQTFGGQAPPHPKLSKLENELISQMQRQEKSLIFVRRIATVDELMKRLIHLYDQDIVVGQYLQFTGRWAKYLKEKKIINLIAEFKETNFSNRVKDALVEISNNKSVAKWWSKQHVNELELNDFLLFCYRQRTKGFIDFVHNFIKSRKFKSRSREVFKSLIPFFSDWREAQEQDLEVEDTDEIQNRYDSFFKQYFKKGEHGHTFKQKIYKQNWFDLNLYLLIKNDVNLGEQASWAKDHVVYEMSKEQRSPSGFKLYQQTFIKALTQTVKIKGHGLVMGKKNSLAESSFITEFLLKVCLSEWQIWIAKYGQLPLETFVKHFECLSALLLAVFQNGSGLLPAFIADSGKGNFNSALINLLKSEDAPFHHIVVEIKTIIKDYGLIISVNFQHLDAGKIAKSLQNMSPIVGASGQDKNRSVIAARFRMPGFPYVLVATDIFHEGEDLHTYCQQVYHYGIAWNPSGIEQRTGRVDRINSLSYRSLNQTGKRCFENKIQVYYPYLSRSVEVNQVVKLLGHINRFVEDFNKIEEVQNFESEVSIEQAITIDDIPQAIEHRLFSKYEYDQFKGLH